MERQQGKTPPAQQPPPPVRLETRTELRERVAVATVRITVELVERDLDEPGYGHGV